MGDGPKASDWGTSGSLLIRQMAEGDRERLLKDAERISLSFGDELTSPNQPVAAAYFLESGVASVVKPEGQGERVEIGMIGREGFSGVSLVTGDGRWPYRTFVQVPELTAIRVDAGAFTAALERSASLRLLLTRAVHALLIQIAEGLVSASWQKLEGRLARWLLMYRDRIQSDRVEVTHEFIAAMVSAQRSGVTSAIHELEGAGLIRTVRGAMMLRDLDGLKALADGSYGIAEQEERRLRAVTGANDPAVSR